MNETRIFRYKIEFKLKWASWTIIGMPFFFSRGQRFDYLFPLLVVVKENWIYKDLLYMF